MTKLPPFILASKSPARQAILKNAGIPFVAMPSPADEEKCKSDFFSSNRNVHDLAAYLAFKKAEPVSLSNPYSYVLGADQILVCGDKLFHKPKNKHQAKEHLLFMSSKTHSLINGLKILKNGQEIWSHTSVANLTMRALSETFIDDYLNAVDDSVLSSVGAYHLEGRGAHLFQAIEGDYFSILGLPLLPLMAYLREINLIEV